MNSRYIVLAATLTMSALFPLAAEAESVDFGDDTSEWANDGECDDPRFVGVGMTATPLLQADAFHDASDCRAAHNKGLIRLKADMAVEFGDNSSEWANDGECDDPRFVGAGMTSTPLLEEDKYSDANDCRAAYEAGTLRLK